jgi:hypothetical protein
VPEPGERKRKAATAKVSSEVASRLEAKLTVELATADLEELEQAGVIASKGNRTGDRKVTIGAGVIVAAPAPAAASGPSDSVLVDLGPEPECAVAEPAPAAPRGRWLVVLVYLVATAALAAAIYERMAS